MHIGSIIVQDFRNIEHAELNFSGDTCFLHGANGQGKTNLLEALGMITALRSFRTGDLSHLIRQGRREARVLVGLRDEHWGETEIEIRIRRKGREVFVDGEKQGRLKDIIGRFPVVVLSSQDIQLLRGSPSARRQWMDLVLSSMSPVYYDALRRYHRLLSDRNFLLKNGAGRQEFQSFETMLAEEAVKVFRHREEQLPRLAEVLKDTYRRISEVDEVPELVYKPQSSVESVEAFLELLEENRKRDEIMKTTQQGPHRDDLKLGILNRAARDFASEGQQRGLVIGLRIAQYAYFKQHSGIRPVLLADDILGELDAGRRQRFWDGLEEGIQVIATGTQIPDAHNPREWQLIEVIAGAFSEGASN